MPRFSRVRINNDGTLYIEGGATLFTEGSGAIDVQAGGLLSIDGGAPGAVLRLGSFATVGGGIGGQLIAAGAGLGATPGEIILQTGTVEGGKLVVQGNAHIDVLTNGVINLDDGDLIADGGDIVAQGTSKIDLINTTATGITLDADLSGRSVILINDTGTVTFSASSILNINCSPTLNVAQSINYSTRRNFGRSLGLHTAARSSSGWTYVVSSGVGNASGYWDRTDLVNSAFLAFDVDLPSGVKSIVSVTVYYEGGTWTNEPTSKASFLVQVVGQSDGLVDSQDAPVETLWNGSRVFTQVVNLAVDVTSQKALIVVYSPEHAVPGGSAAFQVKKITVAFGFDSILPS